MALWLLRRLLLFCFYLFLDICLELVEEANKPELNNKKEAERTNLLLLK